MASVRAMLVPVPVTITSSLRLADSLIRLTSSDSLMGAITLTARFSIGCVVAFGFDFMIICVATAGPE